MLLKTLPGLRVGMREREPCRPSVVRRLQRPLLPPGGAGNRIEADGCVSRFAGRPAVKKLSLWQATPELRWRVHSQVFIGPEYIRQPACSCMRAAPFGMTLLDAGTRGYSRRVATYPPIAASAQATPPTATRRWPMLESTYAMTRLCSTHAPSSPHSIDGSSAIVRPVDLVLPREAKTTNRIGPMTAPTL